MRPSWAFEREHGEEGDGDDEQGEEDGAGDFFDCGENHFGWVAAPGAAFVPLLEAFVGLFDDDDGGIDEFAKGNGNAGE